jgi:hypothetical protein
VLCVCEVVVVFVCDDGVGHDDDENDGRVGHQGRA